MNGYAYVKVIVCRRVGFMINESSKYPMKGYFPFDGDWCKMQLVLPYMLAERIVLHTYTLCSLMK